MTMANYKTRVSLLAISLVFALTAFAPIIASANHHNNPPGNNGTIKVNGTDISQGNGNDPHISGCEVNVSWAGFDSGYKNSYVKFEAQSPTNTNQLVSPIGNQNSSFSGSSHNESYTLDFSGSPQPNQGYHVKVTVYTQGSQGNGTKSKVFWIEGCEQPETKYYFQFAKKWAGDEIDKSKVKVVFYYNGKQWIEGVDPKVQVEPGQVLSDLKETVTGLPENCTYEADELPKKYYTPFPINDSALRSVIYPTETKTLTVTNTVTCEDEGEVLGTTTSTTPKTTVASLPNTGSKVAAVAAILTAITTGAAMFSTTLRSALVKFTN